MRYNPRMRLRAFTLVPLVLLTSTLCLAQGQPDYKAARQHYMDATAAEKNGDYTTAAAGYAAAYDITKDPVLFYKIAHAYEKSGDNDAALVYYRRYVNEAKDAKDRDQVTSHIKELEGGDAIVPPPDGDGDVIPPDGDGDLIAPPPDGDGQPDGDQPPAFMDEPARWQRTAAWVSVGVAAVLLTSGAVLGESALSRQEDIARLTDYRNTDGTPTTYANTVKSDYEDAADEGTTFEKYAIISFAGAGVAALAAGVFFYLDVSRPKGPERTTWIHPYVTPGTNQAHDMTAGVVAGWEF